jgi:hypothetical protein
MAAPVPGFREQAKLAAGHVQSTITVSISSIDVAVQAHAALGVYSIRSSSGSSQLSVLRVGRAFAVSHVATMMTYFKHGNVLCVICMRAGMALSRPRQFG